MIYSKFLFHTTDIYMEIILDNKKDKITFNHFYSRLISIIRRAEYLKKKKNALSQINLAKKCRAFYFQISSAVSVNKDQRSLLKTRCFSANNWISTRADKSLKINRRGKEVRAREGGGKKGG